MVLFCFSSSSRLLESQQILSQLPEEQQRQQRLWQYLLLYSVICCLSQEGSCRYLWVCVVGPTLLTAQSYHQQSAGRKRELSSTKKINSTKKKRVKNNINNKGKMNIQKKEKEIEQYASEYTTEINIRQPS
jgi:hypothetical protein